MHVFTMLLFVKRYFHLIYNYLIKNLDSVCHPHCSSVHWFISMDMYFSSSWLVLWLCFTPHRQRGHLETAPPFTVPCEGHEARLIHRTHWESNPGPSRGSPLLYRCATPAPFLSLIFKISCAIMLITSVDIYNLM